MVYIGCSENEQYFLHKYFSFLEALEPANKHGIRCIIIETDRLVVLTKFPAYQLNLVYETLHIFETFY